MFYFTIRLSKVVSFNFEIRCKRNSENKVTNALPWKPNHDRFHSLEISRLKLSNMDLIWQENNNDPQLASNEHTLVGTMGVIKEIYLHI